MSDPNAIDTTILKSFQVMRPTACAATGQSVRVQAAGLSHTGHIRTTNEDHFIVARLARSLEIFESNLPPADVPVLAENDGYILAIADGVGGLNAGERASSLVIARGIELMLTSTSWGLRLSAEESALLMERMRDHLERLNDSLREAVEADPALAGMATTLSVVYTIGLQAFIVHVGDSRVYLFRDGELTQLTRDHTVAQDLADEGQISADEIRRHPRKHVLTNVIVGGAGFQRPDINSHQLHDGDLLLLCTDGLTDLLEPADLTRIITDDPRPKEICYSLIDAALNAGGKDNVTAVAARYTLTSNG